MSAENLFDHPGLLTRAIAEASDDVIFAKDLEGRYRFANPATLAVFGLRADQVVGHTDLEILGEGETAHRLRENDLIVSIRLPLPDKAARSVYLKAMDRAAFSFALAGVAALTRSVDRQPWARCAATNPPLDVDFVGLMQILQPAPNGGDAEAGLLSDVARGGG